MQTKTFPARIKLNPDDDGTELEDAATDDSVGQFEALVSVFGTKDSYGEVVMPGAFTKSLAEWETKGDPIPVYWSHRLDDPDFNIGHVIEAKETDDGLYIKAQLDLDNPKAVTTHNLLRSRRVTDFSFSFDVPAGGAKEGDSALELHEINLYEVGPTPIGANPDTQLIGVKAGRVLSAKNVETIKTAMAAMKSANSALGELLKLASPSDDDEKAIAPTVKTEEPPGVKVEEPAGINADHALALINLSII